MKILEAAGSKKGHYSPGVIINGTLYVSGQLPIVSETGKMATGGIRVQTEQALKNVEAVLMQAGVGKEQVGLCRLYVADIELWDAVNEVYAAFFGEHKPARVVVPTRNLHYGAMIEIEAAAEMPASTVR